MSDKRLERPQPIRRCTGCGEHFPKKTLTRIVRTPEGEIILDPTGKKSGRGAYICKSRECLKRARKSGRIEQSLGCPVSDGMYKVLEENVENAD